VISFNGELLELSLGLPFQIQAEKVKLRDPPSCPRLAFRWDSRQNGVR